MYLARTGRLAGLVWCPTGAGSEVAPTSRVLAWSAQRLSCKRGRGPSAALLLIESRAALIIWSARQHPR
jgi:hypothetical protein